MSSKARRGMWSFGCSLLSLIAISAPAIAQPANDRCADPQFIPILAPGNVSILVDATGATSDLLESGCQNLDVDDRDIWFQFTAPFNGVYLLRTLNINFDTTLALWSINAACSQLGQPWTTRIGCNDDFDLGDFSSYLPVNLHRGSSYRLRIGSIGPPSTCILNISVPSGQSNDVQRCCRGESCTVELVGTCNGVVATNFATCGPADCLPRGICCIGSTCRPRATRVDCIASGSAGARFRIGFEFCTRLPVGFWCCFGDYDQSGQVQVPDIFAFLDDWFAQRPAAVVGGDGQTGTPQVPDIFAFLGAWFAGC